MLAPVEVATPVVAPAAPSGAGDVESARPGRGVTARALRTGIAAAGLLVLVVALLVSSPVLVLCALVLSSAGWLGRRVAVDLIGPLAVLALLAGAVALGQVASALGADLLQAPRVLVVVHLGLAVTALYRASRPDGRAWTVPRPALRGSWLAYLPAAAAAAVGLAQLVTPRLPAGWAFLATDLAQHMILLRETTQAGALDYSSQVYPRGLHMLLGLASAPVAGPDGAGSLVLHLQVMAAVSWLSCAVLLGGIATAVLRLTAAAGLGPRTRVCAAAASAALPLVHNDFLAAFLFMGAAPSLLAMLVLALVVLLPAAVPAGSRGPLHLFPVLALAVMLLAHLWQALAVVPVVVAVVTLARPEVRAGLDLRGARPWALLLAAVVIGASAWSATLAVLGTVRVGGLDIAGIPGNLDAHPVLPLAAGVVGALLLAALRRSLWTLALLGAVLGNLVVLLVLLKGAGGGLDLAQYYPRKALWFLWVLLMPLAVTGSLVTAGVVGRAAWRIAGRWAAGARLLRFAAGSVVLALFVSFVLPQHLSTRPAVVTAVTVAPEASTSARRLALALEHGGGSSTAVAVPVMTGTTPMPDRWSSHVVSKLLSFQTGQPLSFGVFPEVCSEVEQVSGGGPAYVLTDLDPALMTRMMLAKGCADVPVVQAPGGSTESDFMAQIVTSALAEAEGASAAD